VVWAAAVVLCVLAVRLALTPLAAWRTRQVLGSLRGYRADFADVSVSLLRLSYSIHGLQITPTARAARASNVRPWFRARRIEIGLDLPAMLHRKVIVAAVDVEDPALHLIIAPSGSGSRGDARIGEKMSRLSPLAIERVQVKRAELVFADLGRESTPAVRLHDLDAALENLATRPTLANGEPALLAVSGTLQQTGQVSIFVTADPFAERVTFSGRASVKRLDLREIGSFLADEADLAPRRGTLDLIAEFHVREGRVRGGVKPVLKDVEMEAVKPGVKPQLKKWLVEKGQRPEPRRDAARSATGFIPIGGDVTKPDADTWAMVLQLLRNAFTTGLGAGLEDLSRGRGVPQAREAPRRPRRR
jgi:hypothetical protein